MVVETRSFALLMMTHQGMLGIVDGGGDEILRVAQDDTPGNAQDDTMGKMMGGEGL